MKPYMSYVWHNLPRKLLCNVSCFHDVATINITLHILNNLSIIDYVSQKVYDYSIYYIISLIIIVHDCASIKIVSVCIWWLLHYIIIVYNSRFG